MYRKLYAESFLSRQPSYTLAISVSLSTAAARIGPTRVVTVSLMAAAYLWVYSYMWLLAAGCNQILTARLTGFRCCTW